MQITMSSSSDGFLRAKLGTPTPKEALRLFVMRSLYDDVMKGDYIRLKKIYDYGNITPAELLNSAYTNQYGYQRDYPEKDIFLDMLYVIYEKSDENFSICEYALWVLDVPIHAGKTKYTFDEYRVEIAKGDISNLLRGNSPTALKQLRDSFFSGGESKFALLTFNDGDLIFTSKQWERYVDRRMEELGLFVWDYYKLGNEQFYAFSSEAEGTPNPQYALGFYARFLDGEYDTPTGNLPVGKRACLGSRSKPSLAEYRMWAQKYHLTYADFLDIAESWLRGYIIEANSLEEKRTGQPITKLTMARKYIPQPKEFFEGISYLAERKRMAEYYNRVKDKEYLNFTWDGVFKGSEEIQQANVILDLKNTISNLEAKLSEAQDTIGTYKERLDKVRLQAAAKNTQAYDVTAELAIMERQFQKMLDEKTREIEQLQEHLQSKDEYIYALSLPVNEDTGLKVSAEMLQPKRYLFVGFISDEYKELKKLFPNSIFMENAQHNPSNIQVDAVVFLIRNMSHAMFYKVQNIAALKDIPRVYCNNRGLQSILNQMYAGVFC